LRPPAGKRYKEMPGINVLVEYPAGQAGVEGAGTWSWKPAGLDAGEITDKGYVNQRQVLANRAALVELLYAQPATETPENPELPAGVIEAERTA
jgi:feruloyl-CoA synthase